MARTIGIGVQDYEKLIKNDYFYIDKTGFIKEWWESGDDVTLVTRPRRFGKTLNLNMLDYFFSNRHLDRGDLFEGLSIWKEEKYRQLQAQWCHSVPPKRCRPPERPAHTVPLLRTSADKDDQHSYRGRQVSENPAALQEKH